MTKWRTSKDADSGRARVETMDEHASDLTVEVVELIDGDGPYWAVNVVAFGPRPVRVFTNGSLEESLEWAGEQWG